MSSLAAQLAQHTSLNAALLVDRSKRKPTLSYLFTGKDADEHDLEAIHALGINALLNLATINPKLRKYEDPLFSESAKETDRTLLTREAAQALDSHLEQFLWLLSPYLLQPPTGRILEWLVRRFRIHEFNVDSVLALFLPYHESPHYTKMISILQIKSNSVWSFLLPYKSAAQKLSRVSLVTEMLKNSELSRFVIQILPNAIKKGYSHHTLVAFNAATLSEYIKRSKAIDEGIAATLLAALLEPLRDPSLRDAILGSYILLVSFSQKTKLSTAALNIVLKSVASSSSVVGPDQVINSLIAICASQAELEKLPPSVVDVIVQSEAFQEALRSGFSWTGVDKLVTPLVKALAARLPESLSQNLLETFIAVPLVPRRAISLLAEELLRRAIERTNSTVYMSLLSSIQQRYPSIIEPAAQSVAEEDEDLKNPLDQLIISFSALPTSNSATQSTISNLFVSACSADATVRVTAVKEALERLGEGDLVGVENVDALRDVLIGRVQDTDVAVLEALYQKPSSITPIFASDPNSFIHSICLATSAQAKPKRNFLRLHFTYLLVHFWKAATSDVQHEIFHRVILPFLLLTKPRQKTAELIWDLIGEHVSFEDFVEELEWIKGCGQLVKQFSRSEEDSIDVMNKVNFAISEKIAENILGSSRFDVHLDKVLTHLLDENSYTKLLSYLIVLAIVKQASLERQIDSAAKVLQKLALESLSGVDDLSQEHLALDKPGDVSNGKYIVTKPNGKTATQWMQILVVANIARIPFPTGELDWVSDQSLDTKDSRYIFLMRSVYQLANASTGLPIISSAILQLLFGALKDKSLAFLAGIWAAGSVENFKDSEVISLLHGAAFLEAHILEDDGTDFQTILPALLVALQSSNPEVRQGALECISRVRILADKKLRSVYLFDAIYGQSGDALQYLDQDDLKRYLEQLVSMRDHFMNDGSYLQIFHSHHLQRVKGDKKRDNEYKHRVSCYLLSHINAVSSTNTRMGLLRSILGVKDESRLQILLPTVRRLLESPQFAALDRPDSGPEQMTTALLSCFDLAAAGYLNSNTHAWETFINVLEVFLGPGVSLAIQQALSTVVQDLFSHLNQEKKAILCDIVLSIASNDISGQSLAKSLLSPLLSSSVPIMIQLLNSLLPSGSTLNPRPPKRVKTTESPEEALPRLNILAEILGSKSLPASLELVTTLLETINRVVQAFPSSQSDVSYVEQLLMSAVESSASKITEVPNISPSVIRLDVLVEVIRVSANPQTFNQALLLIASLARLAPESVLHNVMPVFTFMGSNVFHRDDAYSFKVVQQTIDGIVPVMVTSLKKADLQPLELYLAAKEFLHVFTDAANHIPRHRRNNFFVHLVEVLGPHDFLSPVCMLLVEKTANRVTRQASDEIQTSLSLPISTFQHNDPVSQIRAANEILNEAQRLVAHIINPSCTEPIFLQAIPDGEHSLSASTLLKRRAQALITFIGFALKSTGSATTPDDDHLSTVISKLITLADTPSTPEIKADEISDAARSALNRLLGSMAVHDFIESVHLILQSTDIKAQCGALDLLSKRVPDISQQARPKVTHAVVKILTSTKMFLNLHKSDSTIVHAFHGIKAISDTLCPGEEGFVAELVPFILDGTNAKGSDTAALSALVSISGKIGPRVIPFFRSIISRCISILQGQDSQLYDDALGILHGLLKSIPLFWSGKEVKQVVQLHMDQFSVNATPLCTSISGLVKALTKKVPAKVLIPSLAELWGSVHLLRNATRIMAFFETLNRSIQHADRPTVEEHLRTVFNIILEGLDAAKGDDQGEKRVISAFKELVVKLNEPTFKPLFRRLYDWAFTGDTDIARRVAFCHLYSDLLDFFKGLMVPYISFLLGAFQDTLSSFKKHGANDFRLWTAVIGCITRALNFDDNGFWRDDKLRDLSPAVTSQIEVCIRQNFADGKQYIQDCLEALVEAVSDDTLVKSINLSILMHTRSEDARIRIFALSTAESLWRSHGGKLLGFVSETATFIAECGEDENDVVVKESFRLKDAVESIAGKIDGL